jgi:hypothetical protein
MHEEEAGDTQAAQRHGPLALCSEFDCRGQPFQVLDRADEFRGRKQTDSVKQR